MKKTKIKKKKIIGIDVDGTFNNFTELFIKYFKDKTGEQLTTNDIFDWNLKTVVETVFNGRIDGEIANDIMRMKEFILELEILSGTLEIFKELLESGEYKPVIVTALYEKELIPFRDIWIEEGFKGLDIEVYYETNKSKIKMDYLVDDAIHNLDDLSKVIGVKNCICIRHPYNSHCKYHKVDTLREAIDYIYVKENYNNESCA